MSVLHPSRTTLRLLKLASLGLAGLIAGLLSGCSSSVAARLLHPANDTDWQTSSTYASATASSSEPSASSFQTSGYAARTAPHSRHPRPCYAEPCQPRSAQTRTHGPHL